MDPSSVQELEKELLQMNLFVIPITEEFFFRASIAREEMQFAIKNNIPIIPILLDSRVEDSFNMRFRNIQYIDKYVQTDYGLRYEEKLQNAFEDMLLGKVLIERIRKVFDYALKRYIKHGKEISEKNRYNEAGYYFKKAIDKYLELTDNEKTLMT